MASLVNPSNINGNFPIAGQDNDSQGFRDNFTNIRNNFTFIKSEIEDLQSKAVLKSALIGTTLNNDFQGSKVKNLQVSNLTETVKDLGQFAGGDLQIDLAEGNIIKLVATSATDITINQVIKNWPSSLQYARILMYVTIPATSVTVTLPDNWTTDLSSVPGLRRVDNKPVISYSDPGDYVYEVTSVDSGTTVYFRELTSGNAVFRDPNFYMLGLGIGKSSDSPLRTGFQSPTLMMGFSKYLNVSDIETGVPYLIDDLKASNDTLLVKGSITSYQSHEDDTDAGTAGDDSLTSAGFSVVKDRTYIDTGDIVSLGNVNGGDLLGYYNAIGYTYNNLGATQLSYQQLGAIQFVAEGTTNSPFGIGGKILIKTKGDGTADGAMPNETIGAYNYYDTRAELRTAVEIDNMQNVIIYGNLSVMGQTTVVESTTVSVQDKNIVLGQGGTETTNQGAGFTVASAAADGGANLILNNTGWITNRSFTIANTSPANALVVNGNTRVGGNLYVDGNVVVKNITYQNIEITTSTETVEGVLTVSDSTPSTSTSTGALVVTGGIGAGNGLYVNGTAYLQNFSTANAEITGGDVYNLTHFSTTGGAATTFTAGNFTSGNIWIQGGALGLAPNGQVLPVANIYATLGYMANFSSPNVVITGGSINGASISGLTMTGGTITDATLSNATITGGNLSGVGMTNVQIGSEWSVLSRANLVVANIRFLNATAGNITTLSAPNFSSANIYQTGTQSIQTSNILLGATSTVDLGAAATVYGGGVSGAIGAPGFTGNMYLQSANLTLKAGSTTIPPIRFRPDANSLTSTPLQGAVEYDGITFYTTPSAQGYTTGMGRGVLSSAHTLVQASNVALNNNSGTLTALNGYSLFGGPIATNTWHGNAYVGTGTYAIEGRWTIAFATGGALPTASALIFTFEGGTGAAVPSFYSYDVSVVPVAGPTNTTNAPNYANTSSFFGTTTFPARTTAAAQVLMTHSYTNFTVKLSGHVRVGTAGNLAPVVGWSVNPAIVPISVAGNYIKLTPIGTNTGNLAIGQFSVSTVNW